MFYNNYCGQGGGGQCISSFQIRFTRGIFMDGTFTS